MTDPTELTRRTVLALGSVGAVGGALTLAGCAPDAPTGAPPASVTDEPGTGATSAPDAPAVGGDIAALADVPVGGSFATTVDGEPVLIAQPTEGQVVAFSAICTHQQCIVAAKGDEFHCPCHGSKFEAATGEVIQGPALEPLAEIPVAVSGDRIVAAS
jgi:Rieske Fe-S protein